MPLGYCTNVHAGASLEETWTQLQRHAVAVRGRFAPLEPMGLGLWLSAPSAAALLKAPDRLIAFRDWLAEAGLVPFTFNGFPCGNFHQAIVKHRVYEPRWDEPERLTYTLQLIELLDRLLPPGVAGSISTLPLAWSQPPPSDARREATIRNLRAVADRLAELEDRGRSIVLALEPEPGCRLETSEQIVRFFEDELLAGGGLVAAGDEDRIRRTLGVCHDVCHAVVMGESQREVLGRFRDAGLRVGKVQLSSAVIAEVRGSRARNALEQLASFAEDRYLHQTTIAGDDGSLRFYEDLPAALAVARPRPGRAVDAAFEGTWRIHFHVPVYLEHFGHLQTSQAAILECIAACRDYHPEVDHFEVETYAWGVLPAELQRDELADGIADELAWAAGALRADRRVVD